MRKHKEKKREIFYKEFKTMNPSLVFGLIIISFGMYIISWLYTKNKEFELLDEFAPDATRGTIILFMLPLSWLMFVFFLKNILGLTGIIIDILEIVVWGLIVFMIFKYFFDFCMSFGRITETNGFHWFLLTFIIFIAIPAMQAELNSHFERMGMRRKSSHFYG